MNGRNLKTIKFFENHDIEIRFKFFNKFSIFCKKAFFENLILYVFDTHQNSIKMKSIRI